MKVDVVGQALEKNATAENPKICRVPYAVSEDEGFQEAISCDILFSCVDRPLGRYVLNYISYAYLIPVVDGGIRIDKTRRDRLRHASWRFHNVYPGTKCLACHGQYDPNDVSLEREGRLDDPAYISDLADEHPLKRNENVFCFSSHLASSQILHMLHLVINPAGISEVGAQTYHFPTSSLDSEEVNETCFDGCYFTEIVGKGDSVNLPITSINPIAQRNRKNRNRENLFWDTLTKFF